MKLQVIDIFHLLYFRLGLAYAGSNRDDVLQLILPVLGDSKASMEVKWISFISLSFSTSSS